jgi:FkbM family methyltransferase
MGVLNTFVRDMRGCERVAADTRSRFRLIRDFLLSRFIRPIPKIRSDRLREISLRGGIKIRYRLNKGDINSIREIWLEEAYRLPFEDPSGVLLDLGANIGMTSVWLAKRFPFTQVIAVEPDPKNAAVVRQNFELNRINGCVVEAAIGPSEGIARFEFNPASNLGRLSENGSPVPIISVGSIIRKYAIAKFALIKVDIEGGEQELFDGPIGWLALTDAIIIEFHPALVDYQRLARLVCSHGFTYIPADSVFTGNMDCFKKKQ